MAKKYRYRNKRTGDEVITDDKNARLNRLDVWESIGMPDADEKAAADESTPEPDAAIRALSRGELNELAANVGVEDAEDLGTDDEVIQAIDALDEPNVDDLGRAKLNAVAQLKGVVRPEKLQNKPAVVKALAEKLKERAG